MARGNEFNDEVVDILSGSGLRIAETLEIHDGGSTWWNLINHSQEIGAKVPLESKKSSGGGAIEPGQINLSQYALKEDIILGRYKMIMGMDENNQEIYIRFTLGAETTVDGSSILPSNKINAYVYDSNLSLKKYVSIENDGTFKYGKRSILEDFFIWDNVGKRAFLGGVAYGESGYSNFCFVYNYNDNTLMNYTSYSHNYSTLESSYWSPENPDRIIMLHEDTENGVILYKYIPEAGESNGYVISNLTYGSGESVQIALTAGYKSRQIFAFFSSALKTLGVVWIDSASGKFYYALENENWSTLHEITGLSGHEYDLVKAGTIPVSQTGDFLAIYADKRLVSKVIVRPEGFAYAANSTLCGAGLISTGVKARVFTRSGDQWVAHSVTLGNMEISGSSSTAITLWDSTPGYGIANLFYETEERELWQIGQRLLCVEKSTDTILWGWDEWKVTRFTKSSMSFGVLWKVGDHCLFCHLSSSGGPSFEPYLIPLASLVEANTKEDVNVLLNALPSSFGNVPRITPSRSLYWAQSFMNDGRYLHPDHRTIIEDNTYFYVHIQTNKEQLKSYGTDYIQQANIRIRKSDLHTDMVAISHYTNPNYWGSADPHFVDDSGIPHIDITGLNSESDNLVWVFGTENNMATANRAGDRYGIFDVNGSVQAAIERRYGYLKGEASSNRAYLYGCSDGLPGKHRVMGEFYYSPSNGRRNVLAQASFLADSSVGVNYDTVYSYREHPFTKTYGIIFDPLKRKIYHISDVIDGDVKSTVLSMDSLSDFKFLACNLNDVSDQYEIKYNNSYLGVHFPDHQPDPKGKRTVAIEFYGPFSIFSDTLGYGHVFKTAEIGEEIPMQGGGDEGSGSIEIVMGDKIYFPYPFKREKVSVELANLQKTVKVALPDTQDDQILQLVASGKDFRGHRCIVRRLFIDADLNKYGSSIVLMDGYIQDWSYRRKDRTILFSIAHTVIDLSAPFPRRIMSMLCSHRFKGKRCQYAGASVLCPKTLSACETLGNTIHYGGFPWVAARQRRVMFR